MSTVLSSTGSAWNFGLNTGWSKYSENLTNSLNNIRSEFIADSYAFGFSLIESLRELNEFALDAAYDNWDGYGAQRINKESYNKAKQFLTALPIDSSPPEISVDPDGEVSFDWFKRKGNTLSISISKDDEIAFAFRDGPSKNYGKEYYSDVIPKTILEKINKFAR